MTATVTPSLMFEGNAEAAMRFYVGLFDDGAVESITRYGAGEEGPEGTIKQAVFTLNGQRLLCMDSPIAHAFTFTPSISLFVASQSEEEVESLFEKLAEGGEVLMPLDAYPFSRKFGWVNDRFGVSWQIYTA